ISTGASSTTGADADDDLSPAGSPASGAASLAAAKSVDISDMLEEPRAAPGVLRLTDPKGTMGKQKSKQAPRTFEVAETKKQRQNRLKREAQKAVNEESEKERRK